MRRHLFYGVMQQTEQKLRIIVEIGSYRKNVVLDRPADGCLKNRFQLLSAVQIPAVADVGKNLVGFRGHPVYDGHQDIVL